MMRWPGFKAWIWVMGTFFFVAGAAQGGGLQPVQGEGEESLPMSRLLGTPSGLQFLMDWGFFEVLESLHDEPGSGLAKVTFDWKSLGDIALPVERRLQDGLELYTRGNCDDGRVPEFELVVPKHINGPEIDTKLRLHLKRLNFSGKGYADSLATRYDTELQLEKHVKSGSWYSRPALMINYTRYDFRDQRQSVERSVPILEWDNGWKLEKIWGSSLTQVIEPRIYYVFVPRVSQDMLPNYDSGVPDFGYDSLFRAKRLTGRDRIGDANQASLGFSTSFYSAKSDEQYLKAGIAQTIYFSPQASMVGESSVMSERGISDLASTIRARLGDTSIASVMQWDPVNDELAAARAELSQVFGRQVLSLIHQKQGAARFTEFAWDYKISRQFILSSKIAHSEGAWSAESLEAAMSYHGCGWSLLMDTRREWASQEGRYDHSTNILLVLDSLSEPSAVMCR